MEVFKNTTLSSELTAALCKVAAFNAIEINETEKLQLFVQDMIRPTACAGWLLTDHGRIYFVKHLH